MEVSRTTSFDYSIKRIITRNDSVCNVDSWNSLRADRAFVSIGPRVCEITPVKN